MFQGRAAHLVIGSQYQLEHPASTVFLDPTPLSTILERGQLGDASRLTKFVRHLRPDITDTDARVLFEIKPDHEEGRSEGREQAERYLAAINAAISPDKRLEQQGELAEQAIRNAYAGGERPRGFQGQVYRPVDCLRAGEGARCPR